MAVVFTRGCIPVSPGGRKFTPQVPFAAIRHNGVVFVCFTFKAKNTRPTAIAVDKLLGDAVFRAPALDFMRIASHGQLHKIPASSVPRVVSW